MGVDLFIVEQLPLLMKIDSRDSGRIVYGRGSVSKFHSICQGYVFTRVWDCWFVSRFTKQTKKTTEAISRKRGCWIGLSQDWTRLTLGVDPGIYFILFLKTLRFSSIFC